MNARAATRLGSIAITALMTIVLPTAAADEIDRIEREFVERRRAIVRPLIEAYAEKLKALHDSLKLRADRTRAAMVQAERSRILASVENVPQPAPSTHPPAQQPAASAPAVEQAFLQPGSAQLRGGSKKPPGDLNSHFAEKGAIAEWKIPRLRPGRYRLTLVYSCDAGSGGRCELVIPSLPRIRLSIEPNGDQRQVDLGEFDFATSPETLSIQVIELSADAERLMTFESLRLAPSRPDGARAGDLAPPALAPLNL